MISPPRAKASQSSQKSNYEDACFLPASGHQHRYASGESRAFELGAPLTQSNIEARSFSGGAAGASQPRNDYKISFRTTATCMDYKSTRCRCMVKWMGAAERGICEVDGCGKWTWHGFEVHPSSGWTRWKGAVDVRGGRAHWMGTVNVRGGRTRRKGTENACGRRARRTCVVNGRRERAWWTCAVQVRGGHVRRMCAEVVHDGRARRMCTEYMRGRCVQWKGAAERHGGPARWTWAVEMCSGRVRRMCAAEGCGGHAQWMCAEYMCGGCVQRKGAAERHGGPARWTWAAEVRSGRVQRMCAEDGDSRGALQNGSDEKNGLASRLNLCAEDSLDVRKRRGGGENLGWEKERKKESADSRKGSTLANHIRHARALKQVHAFGKGEVGNVEVGGDERRRAMGERVGEMRCNDIGIGIQRHARWKDAGMGVVYGRSPLLCRGSSRGLKAARRSAVGALRLVENDSYRVLSEEDELLVRRRSSPPSAYPVHPRSGS
ncbi:hypothetical protein B0H16DRAFT_1447179 [Mycena metata]|uniref:Uncharacterized protein n=1 Tax=Mycena metata TaxID=1033252 RepID=A0AAD7KCN9_9AGAR|nr:hypothetical protein B0H16DRAFT_1447179 [Mycena metata]